jgi:hypothetical protein
MKGVLLSTSAVWGARGGGGIYPRKRGVDHLENHGHCRSRGGGAGSPYGNGDCAIAIVQTNFGLRGAAWARLVGLLRGRLHRLELLSQLRKRTHTRHV